MKIWLLVAISVLARIPGDAGIVSPQHADIWRVYTDREDVKDHLYKGYRLNRVVFYDSAECQSQADAIVAENNEDEYSLFFVSATCVEFDISVRER